VIGVDVLEAISRILGVRRADLEVKAGVRSSVFSRVLQSSTFKSKLKQWSANHGISEAHALAQLNLQLGAAAQRSTGEPTEEQVQELLLHLLDEQTRDG
jgi:hypothetical protein